MMEKPIIDQSKKKEVEVENKSPEKRPLGYLMEMEIEDAEILDKELEIKSPEEVKRMDDEEVDKEISRVEKIITDMRMERRKEDELRGDGLRDHEYGKASYDKLLSYRDMLDERRIRHLDERGKGIYKWMRGAIDQDPDAFRIPGPKNQEEANNLTQEQKDLMHDVAQIMHPDPGSIPGSLFEGTPGRIRNIIDHKFGDLNQKWLTERAKIMIERSGAKELTNNPIDKINRVLDFGGGKGHIMQELIKNDPKIKTASIDVFDYASEKVSGSEEGKKMDSVFGKGENMPIKDNSVELATAYFTFQELDDKQQEEVLKEMIRTVKEGGRIIIVDEPLREENQKEGISARIKNILRNLKISKFNLHDGEYWRKLFEENGLKIIDKKEFRDDDEEISEENPAQFFSYILEKIEKKAE